MADRRVALVVAVDRYDHPALHQLAAPSADAAALAEVLGDPTLGDFEVEVLLNATSSQTAERVESVLADRRPGDLVLLHFSCHGLKDDTGELYLAATNTRPDLLASTAVDAAWVNRLMQRSRAQSIVLLLDCCYGGAFERGMLARAAAGVDVGDQFRPGQLAAGRGRVVITASTAMEYAFEGVRLSAGASAAPSVFTGAVVEGIRTGDADLDQDGHVALDELYDYVYDRVRSGKQTPSKWEFGVRGNLYVARNPHRPSRPRPAPPAPAPPRSRRRLAAVLVALLLVAGAVVTWVLVNRSDDRAYQALLAKLPASIAANCQPDDPVQGSSAQAYCRVGNYELWDSTFDMADDVHPATAVAGACTTAPTTFTYARLPAGPRSGLISCEPVTAADPAKSYYNVRWGVDALLLTGQFQSDGPTDYAATYQRALEVLAQLP